MKQMQDNNEQLILFKHGGTSCLNDVSGDCVSKIEEFHAFAVETKYQFKNVAEVENENNSCVENR